MTAEGNLERLPERGRRSERCKALASFLATPTQREPIGSAQEEPAIPAESVLALRGVTKDFGALRALDGVDLVVRAGEALALVGDNGAGKSTLLEIVAGSFSPTSGTVRLEGRDVQLASPRDARRRGIEIVHQDLALCPHLTATANIFLGREWTRGWGPLRRLDRRRMRRRAGELFAELRSDTRPEARVSQLSGGQRQAVALARTRLSDPRLVLLDEPTAAISVRQIPEVLALLRRLKQSGIAIVLVTHRLPDVFEVCDRVAVLRRGHKVAERAIADTSPEEVTGLITGAVAA